MNKFRNSIKEQKNTFFFLQKDVKISGRNGIGLVKAYVNGPLTMVLLVELDSGLDRGTTNRTHFKIWSAFTTSLMATTKRHVFRVAETYRT